MAPVREHTLRAADGTLLFITDSPSAAAMRGGVVLMHGLGEHCGRHAHLARFFNDAGWAVRAYDHRGHGRSGGARGDVPDDATILQDGKLVIDDFTRQLAAPPLLFGHSMGGLFAARLATAALAPLRALILSSPALAVPLSGAQKLLLKAMRAVAPGLAIPNGLPVRYLSHDPAVADAYAADPLVHSKISARLLTSMQAALDSTHAHAAALAIPTLLLVAGDDHLVDASGSARFFKNLAPGIGTMHLYHDFYHEIFNEIEAPRVFADVRAWLGKLAGAPA